MGWQHDIDLINRQLKLLLRNKTRVPTWDILQDADFEQVIPRMCDSRTAFIQVIVDAILDVHHHVVGSHVMGDPTQPELCVEFPPRMMAFFDRMTDNGNDLTLRRWQPELLGLYRDETTLSGPNEVQCPYVWSRAMERAGPVFENIVHHYWVKGWVSRSVQCYFPNDRVITQREFANVRRRLRDLDGKTEHALLTDQCYVLGYDLDKGFYLHIVIFGPNHTTLQYYLNHVVSLWQTLYPEVDVRPSVIRGGNTTLQDLAPERRYLNISPGGRILYPRYHRYHPKNGKRDVL